LARAIRDTPGPEAIERARGLLGRTLARAVEKLPPGHARYADIATLMRSADQTEEGWVATPAIEKACLRHGIELPALQARAGPRTALRALDPERPGGLSAMRAALHLPSNAALKRRAAPLRTRRGWREQYLHVDEYVIRSRSLGALDGIVVRV